jgi:hypothetical protein
MQDSHNRAEQRGDIRIDLRIRKEETPDLWEWVRSRRSIAAGVIKMFLQDAVRKDRGLYGIPVGPIEDDSDDVNDHLLSKIHRFEDDQ